MAEPISDNSEGPPDPELRRDAVCPSCKRTLSVPSRKIGFKIKCPVCGEPFRVSVASGQHLGNETVGETGGTKVRQATAAGESAELTAGQLFADRFEIVRKLGEGSFGTVYRAFDKRDYCEVALKLPSEDMLFNKNFMVRFRAEAEILEKMRHPNIVTFYDAQLDQLPRFLVAELIDGHDLERHLKQLRKAGRWIERDEALWIVEKLAGALHHAHLKRVVHRDVKPANIMIARDVVKLTDFGLARRGDPNVTQAGSKIGTPFYMAPEQVAGDREKVGPKSDQYSLAVVLYELLCRKRPFDGGTIELVYANIRNENPADPTSIDSSIPRELANICMKALAKDPAKRWPDCDTFAVALRRWVPSDYGRKPGQAEEVASDEKRPDASSTESSEEGGGGIRVGRPRSVIVSSVVAGTKRIGSRLGEKIDKGKKTLEPLTSAAEPLVDSLGTTVRLSSQTIRARWPDWVQALFGFLTRLVERLNDNLRQIDPLAQAPRAESQEPSPADSSSWDDSDATEGASSDRELPATPSGSGSELSTGAIPLTSLAASRSAAAEAGTQARASMIASQWSEGKKPSYHGALKAAHDAWCQQRRDEALSWLDRCPTESRGWEWAYLYTLCRAPICTFANHSAEVGALAFDRSGRMLAAGEEGGVRVWDTTAKRMLWRLSTGAKRADTVAFSPDGRWLAAAAGRTIRVFDLQSPRPEDSAKVLHGHEGLVNGVAFAADGIHLASASVDESIRIWKVREGTARFAMLGKAGPVQALAFHPDDQERLVSSHGKGTLIAWNFAEECELCRASAPSGAAADNLAVHPHGRILATGDREGTLTFWDIERLRSLRAVHAHAGPVSALAFHPSGRWVVSLGAGENRSLRVGATGASVAQDELGREVLAVPFGAPPVSVLGFSPARPDVMALAGGKDGTVKLWDGESFWTSLAQETPGADRARAVAIHPLGSHRAIARLDGSIEVRNLRATVQPRVFPSRGTIVHALAFHPRQLNLVAAGADGSLTVWDLAIGEPSAVIEAHPKAVLGLAFDQAGGLIATAGADGSARLWDADRHTLLRTLHGGDGERMRAVAFATRGGAPRLFTGGVDQPINVWDTRTGERVASLEHHTGDVVALAASADGRQIVSLGEDRALFVWAADRDEPLLTLKGVDLLAGLAWHQGAGVLAAVCEDRSLIVESFSRSQQS
jgi:eukaryotic-like serine/threonine-protein kinase